MLVVGNFIIDHIWQVSAFRRDASNKALSYNINYGGIFNYLKALEELKVEFSCVGYVGNNKSYDNDIFSLSEALSLIKIEGKTAQASIIAETKHNCRSSIVDWGVYKKELPNIEIKNNTSWIHIAYLDTFRVSEQWINEIKQRNIILTADFCGTNIWDDTEDYLKEIIPYLSILFISMNHFEELSESLKAVVSDKLVVIHDPHYVICQQSDKREIIDNLYHISDKKLNVLGAGDYFTSCMLSYLQTPQNNNSSFFKNAIYHVPYVQEETSKWLKKNNL